MQNQYKKIMPAKTRDSAGNLVFIGIICLAVGLGIGYYFGKNAGSSALPIAAANQSAPSQAAIMDPAQFLQDEARLKAVISSSPKDPKAMAQLGDLYYDNSRFSEAIEWYGRALEIEPNNADVRTDRGTCYWNLRQADAAIAEFQRALSVDPSHPQTLYNLGIVYLHGKNDLNQARQAWEKLLATNPNYPDRSRLQGMLASLSSPAESPAPAATSPAPASQGKPGSSSMEDLFKRMKK